MFHVSPAIVPLFMADRERRLRSARGENRNQRSDRYLRLIAVAAVVIVLAACGATSTSVGSPISEEDAVQMAENALEAFNGGDYAAWSRDWSETMKSAIDEEAFLSFREQFHAALGDYTAITDVTGAPGADSGTYRWTFDVQFERDDYRMWFGFKEGSRLIEGVSFEEP